MKGTVWGKKALELFGKYKYVLLVLLVGLLLLLLPSGEKKEQGRSNAVLTQEGAGQFSREALEEKMEHALSQVDGAGEVHVILTLKEGPRQVLAQEGSATETTRETAPVLAARGSGVQEPVTVQEVGPSYLGALVVAQGAGDPSVKLALTKAVSALTGLGADKISVCKGK